MDNHALRAVLRKQRSWVRKEGRQGKPPPARLPHTLTAAWERVAVVAAPMTITTASGGADSTIAMKMEGWGPMSVTFPPFTLIEMIRQLQCAMSPERSHPARAAGWCRAIGHAVRALINGRK